jgi:hypothetical protein
MWMMKRHDRALSETFSVVIIALLVVAAAILLVASLTGVITNLLQKPALFSVQGLEYDIGSDIHMIGLFHQQGDAVNLNGTAQKTGTGTVSLSIIDNTGSYPVKPGLVSGSDWRPGTMIYVYQRIGGGYLFSDVAPGSGSVKNLDDGTYTVLIVDDKAQTLLHSLSITIS